MRDSKLIKRELLKVLGSIIAGILLMGLTAFFISSRTFGRDNDGMRLDEAACSLQEQEYVREVRAYLAEAGFENSGVNLTWTETDREYRSYEVSIHHDRLTGLTEEAISQILRQVEALGFWGEGLDFHAELLRY